MSLFNRLLNLYKSNNLRTPLEDFTTEVLVYILNAHEDIMNAFVREILKIESEGEKFNATSQSTYLYKKNGRSFCKIDVVLKSNTKICFLENKVHYEEGFQQLISYCQVLDELIGFDKKYMRYCSKFYEEKAEIKNHDFLQFRWCNISNFLARWNTREIISEFLIFLEFNQMGNSTDFTLAEILALESFNPVMTKMNAYLDKIRPRFV